MITDRDIDIAKLEIELANDELERQWRLERLGERATGNETLDQLRKAVIARDLDRFLTGA